VITPGKHITFQVGVDAAISIAMSEWIVEHRKFERFDAAKGALVEIGKTASIVGLLMDVSVDGLSFQYIDIGKRPDRESLLGLKLDNDWFIEGLPFRTVSDFEIPVKLPFGCLTMRRSGIQFQELTIQQMSKIAYFIKKFTFAPCSPSESSFFPK
jgi:hypothetical protein